MNTPKFALYLSLLSILANASFAQDKKPAEKPAAKPAEAKPANPQDKPTKPAEAKPGDAKPDEVLPGMTPEMMKEMQEQMAAAQPGPEHKVLNYMIGTWNVAGQYWMTAEAPPMPIAGVSQNEWFLGNRFVHYSFKSNDPAEPFEGRGLTGYDNIEKKYFSLWIDTEGTGVTHDTGSYDAAKKEFTYTGQFKRPDGKITKTRTMIKIVGEDEHTMTFFHAREGEKERKVMEFSYKRAAKPVENAAK